MDQADQTNSQPRPAPTEPAHLPWDTSATQTRRCSLATASATPGEVILNFGAKRGEDYQGGEVAAELLQRIALSPVTATNLLSLLQRLIADEDARSRPPR